MGSLGLIGLKRDQYLNLRLVHILSLHLPLHLQPAGLKFKFCRDFLVLVSDQIERPFLGGRHNFAPKKWSLGPKNGLERRAWQLYTICDKNQLLKSKS
jgi:hypothetical protein